MQWHTSCVACEGHPIGRSYTHAPSSHFILHPTACCPRNLFGAMCIHIECLYFFFPSLLSPPFLNPLSDDAIAVQPHLPGCMLPLDVHRLLLHHRRYPRVENPQDNTTTTQADNIFFLNVTTLPPYRIIVCTAVSSVLERTAP